MADWKLRPGVILVDIQGVSLLAADKDARKLCGYVCRINETGAFFWRKLSEGRTREEILSLMQREYEILEGADPGEDFDQFIRSLREHRYIISEAEGNEV